jgi:GNAT superfamily N-acetyltransferase
MNQLKFSKLAKTDTERIDEIFDLIISVFNEFNAPDFTEKGVREFMSNIRFTKVTMQQHGLAYSSYEAWICEDGDKIVGVLILCYDSLNSLFVDGKYHRRGIAQKLFNMMIEHCKSKEITVSASAYAVDFYRKMGFIDDPGMFTIPMKFVNEKYEESENV